MKKETLKRVIILSLVLLFTVFTTVTIFAETKVADDKIATEESVKDSNPVKETNPLTQFGGLIGAAIAFGFGAVGAGIAIANVGSAAMGAVAEKPQLAGQALIFIALAEGIVVFGFITALMILGKI